MATQREALIRIKPPRVGEHTLLSFENMLESLESEDPISLELVADKDGVGMYVRSKHPDRVVQQLLAHYPDVEVSFVNEDDDPARITDGERAWTRTLKTAGDDWLPLQIYDNTGLLSYSSDPFIDMVGGMRADVQPGERVLSRMILKQKPHNWSEEWREKALSGAGSENQQTLETDRLTRQEERKTNGANARPVSSASGDGDVGGLSDNTVYALAGAIAVIVIGTLVSQAWARGDYGLVIGVATVAILLVCVAGVLMRVLRLGLWKDKSGKFYDPQQVALRVGGAAFSMQIEVMAVLKERGNRSRAEKLLEPVIAAYKSFDNPLGCRFDMSKVEESDGRERDRRLLEFKGIRGRIGRLLRLGRSPDGVLGVREAAALWHLPGASAQIAGLERAGSKLLPVPPGVDEGVLVGSATYGDGGERLIRLPESVLRRHQLLIASSGQGKSTEMALLVNGRLLQKAAGNETGAVVVVDPHSDLVTDVLRQMPDELSDKVKVVRLRSAENICGINLLDVEVFKNREGVINTIVEVAKGPWDTWGSRMQGIMEYGLRSLYEANLHLPREEQYTILDLKATLVDEQFRNEVLSLVKDSIVLDWWQTDFAGYRADTLSDALAPVLNRIGFYSGSEVARRVVGQRYCTINIAKCIEDGDVLLIDTYGGESGEQLSALVGTALVKVVHAAVMEQGEKEQSDRNGAYIVIDEMQTLVGLPYDSMMRENRKFGGMMCLATQSLASLDQMSMSMRETILTNIGCLFVFQGNALDAQRLIMELDSEHLDIEDVTGLPDYNCYVRVKMEGRNPDYFSMKVLPPFDGTREAVPAAMNASSSYTRPVSIVDSEMSDYMDEQVRLFRDKLTGGMGPMMNMAQSEGKTRGGKRVKASG